MRELIEIIREPVTDDSRKALARANERVPERLRGPRQFLGRQYAGCGATVGAMPRCDFACKGCYLGSAANKTPALPVEAVVEQLADLRAWLGPGGNVQLTDGELTLRDRDEVERLIQEARALELSPMLMTHGEHLLRDPSFLHRLMRAGLKEVSIHIDTTQRGHREQRYREVPFESDLNPLRDEFAALIREARAVTGLPLQVATTVTVTEANLEGVPDIVRWLLANADAFKMVSFQPVADVGRTQTDLGGVSVEGLWERIAKGLAGCSPATRALDDHKGHLGHPDCSHFVQGLVRRDASGETAFVPLLHPHDAVQRRALGDFLDRLGGLSFWRDDRRRAIARGLGLLCREAPTIFRSVLPAALAALGRLAPEGRLRFAWRWLRGDVGVAYLNFVSHHFMSAGELDTPLGRERLDLCAFKTSVDGKLVSMCELNALGVRDRLYERLRESR